MDVKKIIKEEISKLSEKQKLKILHGQELEEARMKKVTERMWKYMSDDKRWNEGKLNEAKYKVGDTVTVKTGANTYKGKIENLYPLRIRTSPSETMVIPNKAIKSIAKEGKLKETKADGYKDPAYRATVKQFKGKKVSKKEFAQALAMHHKSMDGK